jgi:hypothetical protein
MSATMIADFEAGHYFTALIALQRILEARVVPLQTWIGGQFHQTNATLKDVVGQFVFAFVALNLFGVLVGGMQHERITIVKHKCAHAARICRFQGCPCFNFQLQIVE